MYTRQICNKGQGNSGTAIQKLTGIINSGKVCCHYKGHSGFVILQRLNIHGRYLFSKQRKIVKLCVKITIV